LKLANVWKVAKGAGTEFLQAHLMFNETVCSIHGTSIIIIGIDQIGTVLAFRSLLGEKVHFRMIHLVRDPRGFLNSCKKYLPELTLGKIAKWWVRGHESIEMLNDEYFNCDLFFLRYEDLCENPSGAMQQVFHFFNLKNQDVCQYPDNMKKFHIMGNKMLVSFDGAIRQDLTWKKLLAIEEQTEMIKLTRPLSSKFGYGV